MLSKETIKVVQSTIPLLSEHGEDVTRHFYKKLLSNNPELNNIFNAANQAQGKQARALAGAVLAYASNLDDLSVLTPAIERIAHKHVSLGVKPDQYPIIGNALLSAIKDVAKLESNDPIIKAWTEAYNLLAEVLIDAEESLYVSNESQTGGWRGFRDFIITKSEYETENVKSLYLKPKDDKPLPQYKGGQYIGVKIKFDAAASQYVQIRQYSLSGRSTDQEYFRITVKAEPSGLVSNYLHQAESGTIVSIQAPTGVFTLDETAENHVFLAGGVGITPLMGQLYEALSAGVNPKNILFAQAQHQAENEVFKREFAELTMKQAFHYCQQWSEGNPDNYINQERIERWCADAAIDPKTNTAFYICGPEGFISAMKWHCLDIGVEPERIHYEIFGPTINI